MSNSETRLRQVEQLLQELKNMPDIKLRHVVTVCGNIKIEVYYKNTFIGDTILYPDDLDETVSELIRLKEKINNFIRLYQMVNKVIQDESSTG